MEKRSWIYIAVIILAMVALIFIIDKVNLLDILDGNEEQVYPILLTITFFVLSISFALRTTDARVSRQGDINMESNALLADANSGKNASSKKNSGKNASVYKEAAASVYETAAKRWFVHSEDAINSANRRFVSVVVYLWSFMSLIITPPIFILFGEWWLIPFFIAIAFFILASIVFIWPEDFLINILRIFIRLLPKPIEAGIIKRREAHQEVIDKHPFLTNARTEYYKENPKYAKYFWNTQKQPKKSSRYEEGVDIANEWIEFWNSLPADMQRELRKKIDVRRDEAELSILIVGHLFSMPQNQDLKDAGEFLKGIGETLVADDNIKNTLKLPKARRR